LTWIEQPVEVDDEIAHVGVVDGLLRLRFPGGVGARVIGEHADDFHLIEILERRVLEIRQLAANDEMEQLLRGIVWHGSFFLTRCPAGRIPDAWSGMTFLRIVIPIYLFV
jgi:hypothetical protein